MTEVAPRTVVPDRPRRGAYDICAVRDAIPALRHGSAHFDGPGGTQLPGSVIDAMVEALSGPLCNRGLVTAGERRAHRVAFGARQAVADLLGADPRGVVFGRSSTQLIYDFARTIALDWSPGDEIVVTRLDHECNVRPWVHAAQAAGVTVRWADFDAGSGELRPEHVEEVLSERTRLVAVTAASNLIGTTPDIATIAALTHRVGALLHVDAAQYVAHMPVDIAGMGADLLTCSAYKFLGPHLGILAAAPDLLDRLRPEKLASAPSSAPERFELGILPYGVLAGVTATVDFLAGLSAEPAEGATRRARVLAGMRSVGEHEDGLRRRVEHELVAMPGVTVYSRAARRAPVLLMTVEGMSPATVHRHLAERGVDTGVGTFYAAAAAERLGLGVGGGVRIGLAPYTDDGDVTRLLDAMDDVTRRER